MTEIPYFEGDFWPNVIEETIKELDQEAKQREASEKDTDVSNQIIRIFYSFKKRQTLSLVNILIIAYCRVVHPRKQTREARVARKQVPVAKGVRKPTPWWVGMTSPLRSTKPWRNTRMFSSLLSSTLLLLHLCLEPLILITSSYVT